MIGAILGYLFIVLAFAISFYLIANPRKDKDNG